MIYDCDKGDRGTVFSNGVEVNLLITKVDTDTGEIHYTPEPISVIDGKLVTKMEVMENVTFVPLPN